MSSNNEDHSQSLDPGDTLQAQSIVLLRRDDLLHIVDNGEADDNTGDDGLLLMAAVDCVDFIKSTEE